MSTKSEIVAALAEGKGSLAKAADDEPVFILRAQDRFAPLVVEIWGRIVASHLIAEGRHDKLYAVGNKVDEAGLVADAMRGWQRRNTMKVPD